MEGRNLQPGEERGGVITVYKYTKCSGQVGEIRLTSVVFSQRTKGRGQKVQHSLCSYCTSFLVTSLGINSTIQHAS